MDLYIRYLDGIFHLLIQYILYKIGRRHQVCNQRCTDFVEDALVTCSLQKLQLAVILHLFGLEVQLGKQGIYGKEEVI